jgi:hypothetical protein
MARAAPSWQQQVQEQVPVGEEEEEEEQEEEEGEGQEESLLRSGGLLLLQGQTPKQLQRSGNSSGSLQVTSSPASVASSGPAQAWRRGW